jgi:hypothetical protein
MSYFSKNIPSRSYYQTSDDRNLRTKQNKQWKPLTQEVFVQKQEVATKDGYKLVEPMLDHTQKPHELHLIKKTGSIVGEPWWVRSALKTLGFTIIRFKEWDVVYNVQPNTAEINKSLWLCKHLVRVTPVKFKNGETQFSEKDLGNTRLNLETGEFEIIKPIEVFTENNSNVSYFKLNGVNVTDKLRPSDTFGLDKAEINRDLLRQRQLCKLNDEFFPAQYDYKYDQDKAGVTRVKGSTSTNILEDGVSEEIPQ